MEQAKRGVPRDAAIAPGLAGGGAERIGAYLARQRQLRGISLDELARSTRIPVRSLQRLEAGAFDVDPDGFARGFVRTVATALGLSPDETIARMLPEARLDDEHGRGLLVGLALAAGGLVLAALAGASLWWLASRGAPALAPVFQAREDGLVVRRDAVRALAEAEGLIDAEPAAPAAAPTPGAAPAPEAAAAAPAEPPAPTAPMP